MKIKPVLHRVLVKPDAVEEADEAIRRARALGIEVQLDKREQAAVEVGVVILVGSTCYKEFGSTAEEQGVVEGAKVSFAKYAGKTIKDGDTKYVMLNDEDIIGVFAND
jgi:co-chaperonin GroES (HSP10)